MLAVALVAEHGMRLGGVQDGQANQVNRPGKAEQIPAVVHVDGSARVQTVDPAAAPRLAALLEHFRRLTGIPMLLNTSFNDREPIVETPAHALATFCDTGLDVLCIGDYIAEKPEQ